MYACMYVCLVKVRFSILLVLNVLPRLYLFSMVLHIFTVPRGPAFCILSFNAVVSAF